MHTNCLVESQYRTWPLSILYRVLGRRRGKTPTRGVSKTNQCIQGEECMCIYIFLQLAAVTGAVRVEFSWSSPCLPSVRVSIEENKQFRSVSTEEPEEDSQMLLHLIFTLMDLTVMGNKDILLKSCSSIVSQKYWCGWLGFLGGLFGVFLFPLGFFFFFFFSGSNFTANSHKFCTRLQFTCSVFYYSKHY